ncbi:MAG TPA: mercury methylation corrinoid protein HgcA [Acidobacteriota bacterium]|nr:mercury methylation corrinoid protein HgcA [Acidobacteriota bacterium]
MTADTRMTLIDRLGSWMVRWGFGRERYRVAPGLYTVGSPDAGSPVLVSANYKLSFDYLRRELGGLDVWILVLDTKGINVWCAAGKGTFGTAEIVRRIELSGLHGRVSHRRLIVPQLGAPGVAAHTVKKQTGFHVVYGPVRAHDIKPFLSGRMKATPEMRQVRFTLTERLAVVPSELIAALEYSLVPFTVLVLLHLFAGGLSVRLLFWDWIPYLGALLVGTVVVPALLPWLPFRSFALKGWLAGVFWASGISALQGASPAHLAGNLLLLPALSAYMALNFTGSTTFTSQSGVNKEIRLFARPMAISGVLGVLLIVGRAIWR